MPSCKLEVQNKAFRKAIKAFFKAYLESIREVIENPPPTNSFIINIDKKCKMTLQFSLDTEGQKWYSLDFDYKSKNPIETGTYVGDAYLDFDDCVEKSNFDLLKIIDSQISFL